MPEFFNDDPAAHIAGLIASEFRNDDQDQDLVPISLRVSSDRLAVIDSMAKMANLSRNAMANLLLKAGCYDVVSRLPREVVHDLAEETEGRF